MVLMLGLALLGCAAHPVALPPALPPLPGTDGKTHASADLQVAPFTVLTFFSSTCPCQRFHDPRLEQLVSRYSSRGVQFLLVDSNYDSSLQADSNEVRARGYSAPILSDPRGTWADAFGARYATFCVILDSSGRIRYRGGLDSDKNSPHADVESYLDDALAALTAGQEPKKVETRVLGCNLVRW
jgi:hypothetical protein